MSFENCSNTGKGPGKIRPELYTLEANSQTRSKNAVPPRVQSIGFVEKAGLVRDLIKVKPLEIKSILGHHTTN